MPELPEVETIVREMREASLVGFEIEKATVFWHRTIASHSAELFCKRIAHQKIKDITRRGKFLFFSLSKDHLLVHLRMTGKFLIDTEDSLPHSHERVRLYLSDGRILRYEDQRKFGKWHLGDPTKILEQIGIEPLSKEFTFEAFKDLLQRRHRQIKPFLLDQHFVAGIGNIYADEALWEAKIHPARPIDTLTQQEIRKLHRAIIAVLKAGVKNTGTSLGASRANYYSVSGRRGNHQQALKVFRRDGLPCPRCHAKIKKMVLAQRGTHFCPMCQC